MEDRIGFRLRLGAAIIDFVVTIVAGAILGAIVGGALFGVAIGGAVLGADLFSLAWIVWEGSTGAALGKRLLKIRIKFEDGTPAKLDKLLARAGIKYTATLCGLVAAGTGIAIFHTVGVVLGLVIFVGCFFVLGQKRQAFHDMIAKTAVYRD